MPTRSKNPPTGGEAIRDGSACIASPQVPAETSVDVYTHWPLNDVQAIAAADIYAASQRTCEQIRALTLSRGVRFIDMRPTLRAAAAAEVTHGPRDWNHFNEAGYRVLGETLVRMADDGASTECVDEEVMTALSPP